MTAHNDAAAELERRQALARARKARWKERNPGAVNAEGERRRKAEVEMVSRHREEYLVLVAEVRAEGTVKDVYRGARRRLAQRHHDEWRDVLAAM